MGYVREKINAHVREYFDSRFSSTFIQRNPMLYFFLRGGEKQGKLGQPRANAVFGGMELTEAEMKTNSASPGIFHTYQISEPNDGASVSYGGVTPTAAGFAEDNAGQTETRFWHHMEAVQVRKHSLEMATSGVQIGSLLDRSTAPVFNRMLKRVNGLMWYGGTATASTESTVSMNTQAQQAKLIWDEPLGVIYTTTANNIYGRVDRSSVTTLNPRVIAANTAFASSVVDLNINRYVNNGYTDNTSSATVDGLANKSENGYGVDLFITTAALFNELALQSDGRGTFYHDGLPNHAVSGFKYPIIEHDNVYYTWDKDCPAETMVGLCLDEWLCEVKSGHNFNFLGFNDKSKLEQGGEYLEWGNYSLQLRQSCRRTDLQVRITGLTSA